MNAIPVDIKVFVALITPAEAKNLLDSSEAAGFKNRKISQLIVTRYANVMKSGRWVLSNDAIVITKEGKLINGQHRLMAVIMSGVSVQMLVITNADEAMYEFLDTGKSRTLTDYINSSGLNFSANVTNAAFYIMAALKSGRLVITSKVNQIAYSYQKNVLSLLLAHASLFDEAFAYQKSIQHHGLMPSKAAIVCHALCSYADREKAHAFFDMLSTKQWGSNRTLISLFNALKNIPRSTSERRNVIFMLSIFTAWNAFYNDKEITRINRPAEGVPIKILGFDKETFLEGVDVL